MRYTKVVAIVMCWLSLGLADSNFPLNQPFSDYSAQNSGKTGIIEMPNARVMDDWRIRLNYHYNKPFDYFGLAISPLPRLETNFRITKIKTIYGFSAADGYGSYKDKAIDLKFLLSKEDELLPAVAIGFDDITGTGLYASKYLVLSKRRDFVDLSMGYALGRMGGEDLSKYYGKHSKDSSFDFIKSTQVSGGSFFYGAEFHINPDLSFKIERSTIDYNLDKKNAFHKNSGISEPKNKFNFGFSYNLDSQSNIAINFERGNSIAIGYRLSFGFERQGLYYLQDDPKWRANENVKEFYKTLDNHDLAKKLAYEVSAEKLSNVDVKLKENRVWVGIENPTYDTDSKAMGRAADVVDEVAPKKIEKLYITLKNRNIEHSVAKINRQDVKYIKNGIISSKQELDEALEFSNEVKLNYEEFLGSDSSLDGESEVVGSKYINFIHRPHLQTFLNAKDNPLVYRFTWLVGTRANLWDGMQFRTRFRIPIASSMNKIVDKTLEPEGSATRTDVLQYQQYKKVQLNDLTLDQVVPFVYNSYARASVGYFEAAYAGYSLEWYKPIDGGRFGIGLEYTDVRKRKVDDMLALKKQKFDTKFVNLYANLFPELGIWASLKLGEFLAGDKGGKLTFARTYKGYTVGAYIAKTDTSIFTSSENRDYIDKGIFVSVPLSLFTHRKSKGTLGYGLSAWTRDVAQSVAQPNSLVGSPYGNIYSIKQNLEDFKE
ncbi:MAG: YjbH domain-containing protein [Arcobacteraceae bacterium]|jgi:hypothetical protein|nr:YjbH domain-containing protein [Arcobacteraceae bacterium]MDY0364526.1 YjbH domain-containing protein [Arcobacteraceae bacterium]